MSGAPDPARSLLIVEDDDRLRERLARALRGRGYETREAGDYDTALAAVREDSPEYMLVDLRIPGGGSGIDLVREVKAVDAATVVVVLTGYGSIATAVEAVRLGAAEYLTKPADVDQILAAFNRAGSPSGAVVDEPEQVPSLARVEWEHINRVLADCGGNVSKAARLLNIHRRSLQRKLSRFPSNR
jgi:two-component system, response regulator RegA